MIPHLGHYNTSSSRTHVGFQFSTHAATGGNVAPSSAIDAADIRIYRAADSAAFSATQRSSSSGVTVTSPFDSLVGFHDVDIDLTDNTDAGFYAAGYRYSVVLAPNDETIDSQTITGVVLAMFEIGGDIAAIKAKTDNLPASPAAVGSPMTLADGSITDATITAPAESAGRPTTILGMIRRLFEGRHNKRTRNRTTGVLAIRSAADDADLETSTQSTSGVTDTITKGV